MQVKEITEIWKFLSITMSVADFAEIKKNKWINKS